MKRTDQPPAPAMSAADIAAHQAASHVRVAPLNPAAQAALTRLQRALTPAVAR